MLLIKSNHPSHFGFCKPQFGMLLATFIMTATCAMQTRGVGTAVSTAVLSLLWPSGRKLVRSWCRKWPTNS